MRFSNWLFATSLALANPVEAAGPTGFGPIKIDMAKDAIEALQSADAVYLSSPMTPYVYKNAQPKAGEDKFDALLVTPLSPTPLKTVFAFEGGKLSSLHITLEESPGMLERVRSQITEKYGPGKTEDNRKEEQCIYKNGANFKLTSGAVSTKWLEEVSPTDRIETSLLDLSLETCPSNLRYGAIGPIKLKSLFIRRLDRDSSSKPKSLF